MHPGQELGKGFLLRSGHSSILHLISTGIRVGEDPGEPPLLLNELKPRERLSMPPWLSVPFAGPFSPPNL